ncbi:MAG: hypothetical protein DME33_05835 [Verrucomicrobia bacterium]|nr:MAG: hypothetical protein DME33_05835 [Verrucomicrobiota bacterium]
MIRVYDQVGTVIETHKHNGEFKEHNIAYSRTHDHSSMAVVSSDLGPAHFDVDATPKAGEAFGEHFSCDV